MAIDSLTSLGGGGFTILWDQRGKISRRRVCHTAAAAAAAAAANARELCKRHVAACACTRMQTSASHSCAHVTQMMLHTLAQVGK